MMIHQLSTTLAMCHHRQSLHEISRILARDLVSDLLIKVLDSHLNFHRHGNLTTLFLPIPVSLVRVSSMQGVCEPPNDFGEASVS